MDYKSLIGYPLQKAEEILKQNNIKYCVKETQSFIKAHDTLLVVNVLEKDNCLTLIVDKFLINI